MSEGKVKELPSTWEWVELDQLGEWAGGGTPSKGNSVFWTNGTTPWVSPKDMKTFEIFDAEDRITDSALENSSASKLPKNAILMVTRSGILRHTFPVAVARVPVALNQDLRALIPESALNPAFIARALVRFGQNVIHSCSKDGTTVQSIETASLKRFRIPLAPVEEQSRILEKLDELLSDLDAAVATLERVRSKIKPYRAAVLKAAVEGNLTAAWRSENPATESAADLLTRILAARRKRWEETQLRKFQEQGKTPPKDWKAKYKEPAAPDTAKLPKLPEGWCWATLDQLGKLDRGKSKHRPRDAAFLFGGPYPFIQTGDVRKAKQYLRQHSQTYSEAGLKQSRLWPAETLCITIAANIAETALLSYPACFPDSVVGALFPDDLVIPRYVEFFMRHARERIEAYAPATAQKNINIEILQILAVPLPPTNEQRAFVDILEDQLSVIDHLEADLEAKLKSAQALRQAILRDAFEGKLVPQDPNDEPAAELLQRIAAARAERAAAAKAAKTPPKKVSPPQKTRKPSRR